MFSRTQSDTVCKRDLSEDDTMPLSAGATMVVVVAVVVMVEGLIGWSWKGGEEYRGRGSRKDTISVTAALVTFYQTEGK